MADLRDLSRLTQAVYARNAARFDAERSQALFERGWLDRFRAGLPGQGDILDVGCGSGRPIAAYLRGQGHRVVGVDADAGMVALARGHAPAGDWRIADMRRLDLPDRFDGILGWHSFFHLTPDEQRDTLPRLARHLRAGGVLMLTVGPEAGEAAGRVGDDPVYHASLSESDYRAALAPAGVTIEQFVRRDPECDFVTVLFARKG